jgi:hypothetical protein
VRPDVFRTRNLPLALSRNANIYSLGGKVGKKNICRDFNTCEPQRWRRMDAAATVKYALHSIVAMHTTCSFTTTRSSRSHARVYMYCFYSLPKRLEYRAKIPRGGSGRTEDSVRPDVFRTRNLPLALSHCKTPSPAVYWLQPCHPSFICTKSC